jgi:hypothetical protein
MKNQKIVTIVINRLQQTIRIKSLRVFARRQAENLVVRKIIKAIL